MAQIGETELDLGALSRALWRRAWLLVLLAVLAAAGTWYALGFIEPLYTADTSILIEERESPLTRPRDESAASAETFDESAIQSQVELLRSREIAEAVIDRLDLTSRPAFDPARRPSIVRSVLVTLGLGENPADADLRQRVMEGYFERLSVYPLQRSRVIGIEFSASDPKVAADVANAIAEAFVDLQQDAKRQSAVAATAWLEQEIERLRARVAESEQEVADYRESHDLFDLERSGGVDAGSLSSQQLGDLSAELIRARAARAEAEARAEQVQSLLDTGIALESSEQVLSSQLVQRLRERQGALRAQIAELSTTLLPTHPRIRSLEEQVGNLELQIRQEAEKVLASLQTAARVAAAREQSLLESLNEAKGVVSRSNEETIELRALEREAAAQRDLLESFLARYREAIARTDANYLPADARVISRAVAPREPSYPKKAMMSVAAAVAVFLIATAFLLLREFMSGRVFRLVGYAMPPATAAVPDPLPVRVPYAPMAVEAERPAPYEPAVTEPIDAAAEPSVTVIAVVASDAETPRDAGEPSEDFSPEEEAATPANIESEEDDDRPGTVEIADLLANPGVRLALFAGADGNEGAGEIAYSTAVLAAENKLRCILIDIGSVASAALGNERPGLGDLLAGDAAFGEVIRRDDETRVHVIPKGSAEKDPPMQRIQLVIGALTHTYDKVIVVAEKLDDWPHEHVHPDLAAIVCGPDTTELFRTELYESALARGAHNALIVSFTGEPDGANGEKESAAA